MNLAKISESISRPCKELRSLSTIYPGRCTGCNIGTSETSDSFVTWAGPCKGLRSQT